MKKRLFAVVMIAALLTGCASSRLATEIGSSVGESFQKSEAKGIISAEGTIKAWPYISGLIKGVFSDNYSVETPILAQNIISRLDSLAQQEQLTAEEKGYVIGAVVRLEALAIESGWNSKYGVSLTNMIKQAILK